MSFWSFIGLADRKTLEQLLNEVQSLRDENRRLTCEKNDLILERIAVLQQENGQFHQELMQNGELFRNDVRELYQQSDQKNQKQFAQLQRFLHDGRMENMQKADACSRELSRLIAGVQQEQERSEQCHEQAVQELRERLNKLAGQHSSMQNYAEQQTQRFLSALTELTQHGDAQAQSYMDQLVCLERAWDDVSQTILEQYHKEVDRLDKTYVRQDDALQKETAHLDKLSTLFTNFLQLFKDQTAIMNRLEQLCQDSTHFLEIQKSIQDLWEIMKVVWVDSLLDECKE